MTDRPILFSAPMILALLAGRKTQTRRLAWGKEFHLEVDNEEIPQWRADGFKVSDSTNDDDVHSRSIWPPSPWQKVEIGDRLWVREALRLGYWPLRATYAADGTEAPYDIPDSAYPKITVPSIHMPKTASRLTLTVTEVRQQRLQQIDGLDALAEGITPEDGVAPWRIFMRLWNSLHGEGAWQSNPEVVALSFSVEKINIDALKAAA